MFVNHPEKSRGMAEVGGRWWRWREHAGILIHTLIDFWWVLCGKLCFLGGLCCRCVYQCLSGIFVSVLVRICNDRLNSGKKSRINQIADVTTGHILVTDVSILQGFYLLFLPFFSPVFLFSVSSFPPSSDPYEICFS